MRILHLRQSCGLYGADRALLDLASATPREFQPIVGSITRPDREDPFANEARRRDLPLWVVQSEGRADTQAVRNLFVRLRDEDISLVHAHDYKSLSIAALAAARAGVPVVATWHGDTGATLALRAYEALARALGNTTRGVAAVSRSLAERLRLWIHTAPVRHIPNGIRMPEPLTKNEVEAARAAFGLEDGRTTLAIVGRLSPEKGHARLFRALFAASLEKKVTVLVAGDGPLAEDLRVQARGLDVRLLGFVSDARPVYAASSLVVMPSLTEGLPLVALEAMALGRAVLASTVGELPVLLGGGAGLLVPSADETAWVKALCRAVESAQLRDEVAARAQARVRQDYGLSRMAARYAEELWRPALAQRKSFVPVRRKAVAR